MKKHPNLRGRYERSVLNPLQWGLLAAIGYLVVLGLQVDALLHTSFSIELFDQEVMRVEQEAPVPQRARPLAWRVPTVAPDDWPAPPIQTDWAPAPKRTSAVEDARIYVRRR